MFAGGAARTKDPHAALSYYREAMEIAEEMPLTSATNQRVSVQEAVVAGIATVDPVRAIDMFHRIDKPNWTAHSGMDMRTRAAYRIEQVLVQKTSTSQADQLMALFKYAGDTGEYPYEAASHFISALHKDRKDARAAQVFGEALQYLQKDDKYAATPANFTDLLLANADFLSPTLTTTGIRAAVESARRFDTQHHTEGAQAEQRTMVLSDGPDQIRARKQATYIALKLLPLASRLDPSLADDLKKQDSDLQAGTAGATDEEVARLAGGQGSTIVGNDPSSGAQAAAWLHQQAISNQLVQLSETDPDKSIAGLDQVQDTALSVNTQAAIARNLAGSDPNRAAALLERAQAKSAKIDDPKERVSALMAIAEAWSELHNTERVRSVVAEGIPIAQKMYEDGKNAKVDTFLMRPGVNELAGLIGVLARVDARGSMDMADSIDAPEVKSYALLSAAQVLLTQ